MSICQIVKFDHIDFSCDESKENNLIKTQYYVIRLSCNTINPNFSLKILLIKMNKPYHKNLQYSCYLYVKKL